MFQPLDQYFPTAACGLDASHPSGATGWESRERPPFFVLKSVTVWGYTCCAVFHPLPRPGRSRRRLAASYPCGKATHADGASCGRSTSVVWRGETPLDFRSLARGDAARLRTLGDSPHRRTAVRREIAERLGREAVVSPRTPGRPNGADEDRGSDQGYGKRRRVPGMRPPGNPAAAKPTSNPPVAAAEHLGHRAVRSPDLGVKPSVKTCPTRPGSGFPTARPIARRFPAHRYRTRWRRRRRCCPPRSRRRRPESPFRPASAAGP